MSNIKETKKVNYAPFLIGIFFFLRSVFLVDRKSIGIDNLYKFSFDFATENVVLIVLLFAFAVCASLVISKLGKKFGDTVVYISALLVADPLLFAKQEDCLALFITVLGLIFVLNGLKDKPVIPSEVALIVFLLVSCVLAENAVFLFVPVALAAYFADADENIFKNTKKIVMLILSVISVGAGIIVNDFLLEKHPAFKEFTEVYTYADTVYFKHIDYENVLLFLFLVPTLAFGVYFFVNMFKAEDKTSAVYISGAVVACAYILSIVGFITGGSDNFYTANYILPVAIIAMINSKNTLAEKSLGTVNNVISKHSLVFISVIAILCFAAVRVFYEGVDNIAGFVLTI